MNIDITVKAYNNIPDKYGDHVHTEKHGFVRIECIDNAKSIAQAMCGVLKFVSLVGDGVRVEDVAAEFANLCNVTPEQYEAAAERAANAACVTLMRGADCRMSQMQQMIDRIAVKVEG